LFDIKLKRAWSARVCVPVRFFKWNKLGFAKLTIVFVKFILFSLWYKILKKQTGLYNHIFKIEKRALYKCEFLSIPSWTCSLMRRQINNTEQKEHSMNQYYYNCNNHCSLWFLVKYNTIKYMYNTNFSRRNSKHQA
jgi:hypothetical protein